MSVILRCLKTFMRSVLKIEKVQRKFTCLINDIGTLTYGARLKSLKLTTLAERRIRGDLIETFKIVTGLVNYGQNMFRVSRSGCNLVSKGIKLNNFHMGIVKEVPARLLDRVEDFFIYSTRAVTESLNRIKVSR